MCLSLMFVNMAIYFQIKCKISIFFIISIMCKLTIEWIFDFLCKLAFQYDFRYKAFSFSINIHLSLIWIFMAISEVDVELLHTLHTINILLHNLS